MRQFVIAFLLLNAAHLSAQVYKVSSEVSPQFIKVNQPFALVFSFKFPLSYGSLNKEKMQTLLMPDTSDFILSGNPTSSILPDFEDNQLGGKYKYAYTLIPRRPGDLVIPMQSIGYNSIDTFRFDSIFIHVYAARITAEDSLKKKQMADSILGSTKFTIDKLLGNVNATTAVTYSPNIDANQLMNQLSGKLPQFTDGIHFDQVDSVYRVGKGKVFEVLYSLSFVNVPGISKATVSEIEAGEMPRPKNIEFESLRKDYKSSVNNVNGKVSNVFTLECRFKLLARKKGVYKIPPVPFNGNGERYMSPGVKVIVDAE